VRRGGVLQWTPDAPLSRGDRGASRRVSSTRGVRCGAPDVNTHDDAPLSAPPAPEPQGDGASEAMSYRGAGVDIDAAEDSKWRLKQHVESTMTAGARGAFGGFGGMFRVPTGTDKPTLVASADGVGTKIKIAIEADRHGTIGHCLVNHCTNDILVQGA